MSKFLRHMMWFWCRATDTIDMVLFALQFICLFFFLSIRCVLCWLFLAANTHFTQIFLMCLSLNLSVCLLVGWYKN